MVFANFLHASALRILVMLFGILLTIPASAEQDEEAAGRSVRRHLDDSPRGADYFREEGERRFLTPTTPQVLHSRISNLQPVVIDDSRVDFPAAEAAGPEAAGPEADWAEADWAEPRSPCTCPAGKPCPGVCRAPGHPEKPHRTMPGDRDRGDCPPYRYGLNDCVRAGNPHIVAPWAMPSVTSKYSGWFVGGGAAFGGRGKRPHEGTWGLDYHGHLTPRHVWMKWTCGRYQGGEGAYAADKRANLFPLK